MNNFDEFVSTATPTEPYLPLFHTCHGDNFYDKDGSGIWKEGILKVVSCPYFGEKLLYFFYGKPVYRLTESKQSSSSAENLPIVIVVKINNVQNIKRVAPFDTGAFFKGMYHKHIQNMQCDDFILSSDLHTPSNIVSSFFDGDNKKYYNGEPTEIKIQPECTSVTGYQNLILDPSDEKYDDRRNTIEVQLSESLNLDGNVLLVILPNIYLNDDGIQEKIENDWGATIKRYNIHRGRPNEYIGLFYQIIESFLQDEDLI
jgi:hypothetical protein